MTWDTDARAALERLAATRRPFSADDLIAEVGYPDGGHRPNSRNNQLGKLFQEASRQKLIATVGYAQSAQPHRKGGLIRVWQGR